MTVASGSKQTLASWAPAVYLFLFGMWLVGAWHVSGRLIDRAVTQ